MPISPQDLFAEVAVIGSMMISRAACAVVLPILKAGDFYRKTHGLTYRAIEGLYRADEDADPLAVAAMLGEDALQSIGGRGALMAMINETPTAAHAEHYARIVLEKSGQRAMIEAAEECCRAGYEGSLPLAEMLERTTQRFFAIGGRGRTVEGKPLRDLLRQAMDRISAACDRGEAISGVTTGFELLDNSTGGFQNGDLITIAGRPSMGKTASAIAFVKAAAEATGSPVLVFSLEMSAEQIADRLLGAEAHIDSTRLRNGRLREIGWGLRSDLANIGAAVDQLSNLDIHVFDGSEFTPLEIRATVRRFAASAKPAMVLLDYLQLLRTDLVGASVHHQMTEAVMSMKAMARELRCPVLALSQLSRRVEQREDKRPVLSDLRESGSIEAESDVVILLYRDAYYQHRNAEPESEQEALEDTEFIIAKQRNGPTGTVHLGFLRRYARFENLTRGA